MRTKRVRQLAGLTLQRHRAAQEIDDGMSEHIVAISRNHVSGIGDVGVLGMRCKFEKGLRALFAQHV